MLLAGYKIELTPEEEMHAYPGHQTMTTSSDASVRSRAQGDSTVTARASTDDGRSMTADSMSGAQGMTAPAQNKPQQQMQQQHAIAYVTTIRNRFHNEPETYRCSTVSAVSH